MPGLPVNAPTEALFTIAPLPWETICRSSCFMQLHTCGWRIVISPIFPQDPKLNVTLLHCAQNLPQDQFASHRCSRVSSAVDNAHTPATDLLDNAVVGTGLTNQRQGSVISSDIRFSA